MPQTAARLCRCAFGGRPSRRSGARRARTGSNAAQARGGASHRARRRAVHPSPRSTAPSADHLC
eukprot:8764944-Alexandrium_andersonii.AAC.1